MPGTMNMESVHITNILGLIAFAVAWLVLFETTHMLLALGRNDRLIGWAIGPLGITTLFLREPSTLFILLNAFIPAIVSACFLYFGLFTAFPSPIAIPHHPLIEIIVVAVGVFITSAKDFGNALRDLRYPLWGEARILRSIQNLRASWASVHFTAFGLSYLRDNFDSNPNDLLKAL